jgi:hypothetical protein
MMAVGFPHAVDYLVVTMADPIDRMPPQTEGRGPAQVSELVRKLVRLMDDAIVIPGTNIRIGWDAILGFFLPAAGDALTAVSQVALLFAAVRARAPGIVIARMVLNVGADALFGSVPLIGDLFDAGFKANRRNLELLDRLQHTPADQRRPRTADYAVLALAVVAVLALIAAPFVVVAWLLNRFG